MQRLEVSGAVRPIYGSLGVKRLITSNMTDYLDRRMYFHYMCYFVKRKAMSVFQLFYLHPWNFN